MAAEKKLEVKDLRISFRTTNGKVQAVRDVSFDLYKGETFAIVGESGSGKSVTSRAIMGILAGNALPEGGKILYDGKDLMKITEEDFHRIRGDKIAMVFQDPLSSLNPIMKVGAQLTEAMLLKNKASRKESREAMSGMFKSLETAMTGAGVPDAAADLAKFKKFELRHCEQQGAYADALEKAREAQALSENLILRIENKSFHNVPADLTTLASAAKRSENRFVVDARKAELENALKALRASGAAEKKADDRPETLKQLRVIADIEAEAAAYPVPDTFSLGYYLTYVSPDIPGVPVDELNAMTLERASADFMDDFVAKTEKAVIRSAEQTNAARREALGVLNAQKAVLEAGTPDRKQAEAAAKLMKAAVARCVDPLDYIKDSLTRTFGTSLDYAMNLFFTGEERNAREKRRYERSKAKHDRIIAKGKTPDWEIIPASYIDLDAARRDMADTVNEMAAHLEAQLAVSPDTAGRAQGIIGYLKEQAQESVTKVTRESAKERAVKLMESVGIDEPRRRFDQYPFEFSGGMRQRIVIAIALTANPDILICDEPTTALDVTIQAQILDLINNLKKERDLSVIFITHDLGVVANMADRIGVMYAGKIVEYGTAQDIFYNPAHPYTWALLSSVPDLDTKEKLESIPGTPPNMIYPPKGDAFAARNKYALQIDFEEQPPMFRISDTHYAATWLQHPDAPKIDPPAIITERIERMKGKRGNKA